MAEAMPPPEAKLICGMIAADEVLLTRAADRLARHFGPVELAGETMDFDFTRYYEPQMGARLRRRFLAFAGLFAPDRLAEVKHRTNALETELAAEWTAGPPRPINLDPGYVEPGKLVLASMKNFAHRVYLRDGVYAEVTLLYRRGCWTPMEWTFPDYASGRYDAFLSAARERLLVERRATGRTRTKAGGADS